MVTSILRPLGVKLILASNRYRLGETIDFSVEMEANADVEIREARVEIVCDERFHETYTSMVATRDGIATPKTRTQEHRVTYVHSSLVFLEDRRMRKGAKERHRVRFDIQPDPPPHAGKAEVKWTLLTTVDVARARDVQRKRTIHIV